MIDALSWPTGISEKAHSAQELLNIVDSRLPVLVASHPIGLIGEPPSLAWRAFCWTARVLPVREDAACGAPGARLPPTFAEA